MHKELQFLQKDLSWGNMYIFLQHHYVALHSFMTVQLIEMLERVCKIYIVEGVDTNVL